MGSPLITEADVVRCLDTLHLLLSRREQAAVFRALGFDAKGEAPLETVRTMVEQHRLSTKRVRSCLLHCPLLPHPLLYPLSYLLPLPKPLL
jgi:hypothetical protein